MTKSVDEISHNFNVNSKMEKNMKYQNPPRSRRPLRKHIQFPGSLMFYGQTFLEINKHFCRDTTIHGFRHMFNESDMNHEFKMARQPWYTKLVTRVIFLISIIILGCACLYMMFLVYHRYKSNPTVTSIETNNYPIYFVPFPAVTLCNINKVYRPSLYEISANLTQMGVDTNLLYEFFGKLSALVNPEELDDRYLQIYIMLESLGYNSETLMGKLFQPCNNLLKLCFWLGHKIPCKNLFRTVETIEGFCCAFNFHALRKDILLPLSADVNETQFFTEGEMYVNGSGKAIGLSVLLDPEIEEYVAVTRPYYGIEVFVHDPKEQPTAMTTIAQAGNDLNIMVKPSIVVSDESIRDLPLTQRMCYFDDEKKLRNSDYYSFPACMAECKVDTILDLCNCIPFFYPETKSKEFPKYIQQCNLRHVNCLRKYRHVYNSISYGNKSGDATSSDTGMRCNCHQSCSDSQYSTNVVVGKRVAGKIVYSLFGNDFNANRTAIHVYFKDFTCIKYRRDVYMTWDTLFASFGGIFGLCLGGSVLSIIEFVYTYTFKLLFMIKSERRRQRTISSSGFGSGQLKKMEKIQRPPSYLSVQNIFPKNNGVQHRLNHYNSRNPFLYGN